MINLTLIGNIGKDAEIRVTQSGSSFYQFSVGVSQGKTKPPVWVDVTISQDYGDKIGQYLRKGVKVYVQGSPSVNAYINKDNKAVGSLRVFASVIELLSKREDDNSGAQMDSEEPVYSLPEARNKPTNKVLDDLNEVPF